MRWGCGAASAPTQTVVATITSDADAYAQEIVEMLKEQGLRTELDIRNEKINYKVREHSVAKTPVMLVVGKKEMEDRSVSIRRLGEKNQEILALQDAIHNLVDEAKAPDQR